MLEYPIPDAVTLCLVTDDELIQVAVRLSCPPPSQLQVFSLEGLLNDQHTLSEHGRAIVQAAAASEAVLVDWNLDRAPVINTLCYHMRRGVVAPVIGLCRGGQEEQIAAVAAGADDVMTLPLSLPLLKVKVLAYHRLVAAARQAPGTRTDEAPQEQPPLADHEMRRFGTLHLDRTAHRFYVHGEEVELTPREFALLDFLIEHADALCTRDQILDHVWGINFDTGTNMVDVYMYFLRRKLEAHGLAGIIQTVRGHGYRLVQPEAPAT